MSATTEAQRLRLISMCQDEELNVRRVLRLAAGELDTLAACPDAVVLAYARALLAGESRRKGHVPAGWNHPCLCAGCGPVWLWPGLPAHVLACPWCWNRHAGRPVPQPPVAGKRAVDCGRELAARPKCPGPPDTPHREG